MTTNMKFAFPAMNYHQRNLDLNRKLIHHPSTTFPFKVAGDNYEHLGVLNGDVLLVDGQMPLKAGDIVVGAKDGESVVLYHLGQGRFRNGHGQTAVPDDIFGPSVALVRAMR
ncbi:MAG: hypothetical protein F6K39_02240 [Okeania sp. SIO3B3]|nr:hypothetical protein [Okeania sp. SIO3B3]